MQFIRFVGSCLQFFSFDFRKIVPSVALSLSLLALLVRLCNIFINGVIHNRAKSMLFVGFLNRTLW